MSEQVVFHLDVTRRRGEGSTELRAHIHAAEMTGLEAIEAVLIAVAAVGKFADQEHDRIGEALRANGARGGLSD